MKSPTFGVLSLLLITGCDLSFGGDDSGGGEQCLDDFLADLGEDRGAIEAEAEARGIAASDVIEELYSASMDVVDALVDCSASQSLRALSSGTNGKYYEVDTAKAAVDQAVDHNKGVTADQVDLVLLIDATGSMSDDLSEVKARLNEVVGALGASAVRVSVTTYRDSNVDTPWYDSNDFLDPDDPTLAQHVDNLTATGGGDLPESLYDGVHKAVTELDWASDYRLIVAITDAPPLEGSLTEHSQDDVIQTCVDNGVVVVPILVNLF